MMMTQRRVSLARPTPARISARAPRRAAAPRSSAAVRCVAYDATTAFLFPGQGAQSVGMAKGLVEEVPAAAELFAKAKEIVGYDLLEMCAEGPAETLNSTEFCQPAIYVSSLAAVEKLRASEGGQEIIDSVTVTGGLSLGEYTALVFSGAMSFEDGLKLVAARGKAMQAAAEATECGMVSIIGLDSTKVAALCDSASEQAGAGNEIVISNYLCPGNYVVSGPIAGCDKVVEIAKPEFKARMTVRLAVSGAFHTEYMSPAAATLKEVLDATEIVAPKIPVISNVDALPHDDPAVIKEILLKQMTSPVQWESSMNALIEKGLTNSYELGPGKVLAGIMKRIDKTKKFTNIEA